MQWLRVLFPSRSPGQQGIFRQSGHLPQLEASSDAVSHYNTGITVTLCPLEGASGKRRKLCYPAVLARHSVR